MRQAATLITVITAGAALALALASPGAAAGPAAASASAALTERASDDVATQAFSPAGCTGNTLAPRVLLAHRIIEVQANTICSYPVARVMVDVTLYRERWWGWEFLDTDRRYAASHFVAYGRAEWWPCRGEHTYRGNSYHESLEGGRYYTASTGSSARRNCA